MKNPVSDLWPGQSVALLKALHILTHNGGLNADSRRKLKQVQHLAQLIKPAIDESLKEKDQPVLADLGADRGHISIMVRGEEGKVTTAAAGTHPGSEVVEPARAVGDSGAPLTTSDGGDAAKGAAIGAVAGLAAGLLALTVPGIGLVLAAGPLAAAIAGGAVVGGVYGGLRDIGIEERHARTYEEWSHIVTLCYAQVTHSIGLNDVCDALQLNSGPLSAIRGATPPTRNNLSHAN